MPFLIPIAAAIAGAVATGAAATFLGGVLTSTFLTTVISSLVGAVVAGVVGYGLNAVLGNKPKALSAKAQDRKQTIRSSIEPRNIVYGTARVSGPIVYATSTGSKKEFLHFVVPVAAHRVTAPLALWINDERIPWNEINEAGFVMRERYATPEGTGITGLANQLINAGTENVRRSLIRIRFFNGSQTTAASELVAEAGGAWTSAHILRETAYMYLRLEYNRDVFANGPGAISIELQGHSQISDPRNNSTGYSNNPALCILHYLQSADGLACSADEIDLASFITAANICDESVTISGGTQTRYTLDGTFSLGDTPLDTIDDMLTSCAGTLVYIAGKYRLHVGAYDAPTDTLTESDLAGPIELVTKPPRRELFNTVRGTFISPARNWQATEFPVYSESAIVAADGEVIERDVEWPFTTDPTRAQRLAKLTLRRAREALTVSCPVKYSGIRYCVWQTINVTMADFGWTNKPFRIAAWTFSPESGIVNLTLREESANSYAWQFGDAAPLPLAPDTDLVDPMIVPPPAGIGGTEELYVTRDGAGVRTRVVLNWGASPFAFVSGYEVQFRPFTTAMNAEWIDGGGSETTRHEIDDLAPGAYEFRVRAATLLARSQWSSVALSVGALAAIPPVAVTGLTIQAIGGTAFLRWDRHPDLDVRVGGRFEIRHTPDATGSANWGFATTLGDAIPGDSTFALLPLKAGTYFIKPVDAGGIYANATAAVTALQATALEFANVTTVTEHSAFSGAKTNTTVASSKLKLSTGQAVGSYAFASGIDLTTVRSVRITSRILAEVVDEGALWDARTDLMDAWSTVDGVVIGGEADAWVEARQTDDDPSGSPTWRPWMRMDASEFRARAFQFRAQLRRYNVTYNIEIAELSVSADEVA
jgi:hypothetical protein